VLAAEHPLRFAGIDPALEVVERPGDIVVHRLAGLGPFDEHGKVVDLRPERLGEVAIFFQAPPALEELLRRFLVLPEIRGGYTRFDAVEFVCGAGGVKDSSAGPSRGARGLRICGADRPVEETFRVILADAQRSRQRRQRDGE
jgi:hypothetical protein